MNQLTKQIEDIVLECGEIILHADRSGSFVSSKEGHGNFVTVYDKKVQQELEHKLTQLLPEAVFVGEEDDVHAKIEKGYAFIVDPIDGTTNFMRNLKESVISVGLLKDGVPYIGVVYQPYLNELFTAQAGCGAYLNHEPIHVSDRPLSEGLMLFGTAPYYEELQKKTFEAAFHFYRQTLDLRRFGAAAYDLCLIASGRAELYFELRLQPWDHAAGDLILKEAGGAVQTVEGGDVSYDKPCSVLATNGCRFEPFAG